MKYKNIVKGIFLERQNRFIATVLINGSEETVHVKNTGRCKEILQKGATVFLQEFDTSTRKTKYDLISCYKGKTLINIDSQVPNKVFYEWCEISKFFSENAQVFPERKYHNSRFDAYIESENRKIFVEIKGATLEHNGVVSFPDAPTSRGTKHMHELCSCISDGYEAYVFFVVALRGAKYFTINSEMDPEFALAVKKAVERGVKFFALECDVCKDSIYAKDFVEIML